MKRKTKKSIAKRFKVTKTGKIMCQQTRRSHRAYGKTTKQKRHLRKDTTINPANNKLISRGLPYRKVGK